MSEIPNTLPLASSRAKQIFPVLTSAQILRIAEHGDTRVMLRGEVLVEQGDSTVPFFVVVSGEIQIVRPSGASETIVAVYGPGQFTGEVNLLSGRPAFLQIRVTEPGEVIVLDRQHMQALVKTDAELSEILMRNGHPDAYIDLERDPDVQALMDGFHIAVSEKPVVICPGQIVLRKGKENRDE